MIYKVNDFEGRTVARDLNRERACSIAGALTGRIGKGYLVIPMNQGMIYKVNDFKGNTLARDLTREQARSIARELAGRTGENYLMIPTNQGRDGGALPYVIEPDNE